MVPARRLGDYDVLFTIATGGMGEVKLARRSGPAGFQKLFAIKVLHPHLASEPTLVESFRREAMLAARVHHPNVVHTFELGQADPPANPEPDDPPGPTFFLVMEHVDGESLAAMLRAYAERGEIAPWAIGARIVRDAAAGLQAAHDAKSDDGKPLGIVHRDVSPPNILVGTDGVARVVDFGIAKAFAEAASVATGKLRGKLSYMSPEQVRGDPLDGRSDVFSLGAVLYEAVTGIRPFRSEHELETVKNVLERDPPRVRNLVGGLPAALDDAIAGALQKDRERRCPSARELARLLDECLRGTPEPVSDHEVAKELERLLGSRIQERRSKVRHALRALGSAEATPTSDALRQPGSAALRPPSGSTEARPETPVAVDSPSPDVPTSAERAGPALRWRTLVSAVLLVAAGAGGALLAVSGREEAPGARSRRPAAAGPRHGAGDPAEHGGPGQEEQSAPLGRPVPAVPSPVAAPPPGPAELAVAREDGGTSAQADDGGASTVARRNLPATHPRTGPARPTSPGPGPGSVRPAARPGGPRRGLRRDDLTF